MKKLPHKNDLLYYLFCFVFISIGVLCFVGAIVKFALSIVNENQFDEVTAEITEIKTVKYSNGEIYNDVYIDYVYDSEPYEYVGLSVYTVGMYEGGTVDILVNPEDPTDIELASQDAIDIVGILVGGVLAGGLGLFLASLKYIPWKKKKNLLEFGYFINAVVDSVEEDLRITAGKKHEHPYIVYCTHTDEVTGMKYKFKSDSIWRNPQPKVKPGMSIKVYVDDPDFINHYVSVEELLES